MRGVSSAVVQVISELRSGDSEREQLEMEAKNVELRPALEPEEVERRLVALGGDAIDALLRRAAAPLLQQRCTEWQS